MKLRTWFNPLYPFYLLGMVLSTAGLFMLHFAIGQDLLEDIIIDYARGIERSRRGY